MGGASKHINNLWETDLTFKDFKSLISDFNVNNLSEKLDGQNFLITCINGKVYGARTGTHLKNFGENAISSDKIWDYFNENTPNEIKSAYKKVMDDFQLIFNYMTTNYLDNKLDLIFAAGSKWMNIEILSVLTENVIHYDVNQIRIHNLIKIDESGNIIKTINKNEREFDFIDQHIIDLNGKINLNYTIDKTNDIELTKTSFPELLSDLERLQNEYNLTDDDNISTYCTHLFKDLLLLGSQFPIEEDIIDKLAFRWGHNNKSLNITKILKGQSPSLVDFIKSKDKDFLNERKKIIKPFIELFSRLGILLLRNANNTAVINQAISKNKISEKVRKSIETINTELIKNNIDSKTSERLKFNLQIFENIGSYDSITPIEGIVFEYNNQVLKITGSFTIILQLIGYLNFKK